MFRHDRRAGGFLSRDQDLGEYERLAREHLDTDPHSSLTKIRMMVEWMQQQMAHSHGVHVTRYSYRARAAPRSSKEIMNDLRGKVDREAWRKIKILYSYTSAGAHHGRLNKAEARALAVKCLHHATELSVWHNRNYARPNFFVWLRRRYFKRISLVLILFAILTLAYLGTPFH